MANQCEHCNLCGDHTPKCSCGCPLTEENICPDCGSEGVCKYCCGCGKVK